MLGSPAKRLTKMQSQQSLAMPAKPLVGSAGEAIQMPQSTTAKKMVAPRQTNFLLKQQMVVSGDKQTHGLKHTRSQQSLTQAFNAISKVISAKQAPGGSGTA